ncbi:MAG: glycosyl hydrolase [Planctomycetota bacterium]
MHAPTLTIATFRLPILLAAVAAGPLAVAEPAIRRPALPTVAAAAATTIEALRAGFTNPPREAGPWVFWFFFDNVMSRAEITRELEQLADAGVAGIELRFVSRRGFSGTPGPGFDPETWERLGQKRLEFLSPEFIDALEHACVEARRLGLRLAINTGMGWPPGGPWVTPQHRSRHLAWQRREVTGPTLFEDGELPPESMVLAWRLDPADGGTAVVAGSYRSLTESIDRHGPSGTVRWNVPEGRWLIGTFRVEPGGLCDKGNGPEVDPGSRDAVLFHLEYVFSRLDPHLAPFYGTTIVDVTTDSWEYEPGGNRFWSPAILAAFPDTVGYDLRERMHALLGYGPDQRQIADDLEQVERAIVHENFFATFTRFVNARGLRHRCQVRGRGLQRDCFEAFAESDVPEVEEEVYLPEAVWTAHALGKPLVSAEAFTFISAFGHNLERDGTRHQHTGPLADPLRQWETNPALLRRHANALYARGINNLVGGLVGFSPPGVPPPGWRMYAEVHLSPHEPWWPFFRCYATWAARMQWVLQAGTPAADALVYPVRSNPPKGPHNLATDQPVSALDAIDAASPALLDRLERNAPSARVAIPRLLLIDDVRTRNEARRILDLIDRGTVLVCCHSLPAEWQALREATDGGDLRPAFAAAGDRGSVVDARGRGWQAALADARSVRWLPETANLSFQHRHLADGEVYLLTNWGKDFRGDVSFPQADLVPEIWNADTGSCLQAGQYRVENGTTTVSLAIGEHESALVAFAPRQPARHAVWCEGGHVASASDGRLLISLDDSGACRVRLSDGTAREFGVTVPPPRSLDTGWTLAADPGRGIGLMSPFMATRDTLVSWREIPELRTYAGVVRYETAFEPPPEFLGEDVGVQLDLGESYELADVWLNGRRVATSWVPPHRLDVTADLKPGLNQLRVDVPNLLKNHLETGEYGRPSGLLGPVRLRPFGRVTLRASTP